MKMEEVMVKICSSSTRCCYGGRSYSQRCCRNDGPDNDGLSEMGSSSLSITVGATDDQNTIEREDDTIAGYSSRGPRRDNGNNNPLDEFKPEVSAPSNIIQAEGCVTSGGALILLMMLQIILTQEEVVVSITPAVTGVIALMMEANPELNPFQIKEILKQTAERRGEPFELVLILLE